MQLLQRCFLFSVLAKKDIRFLEKMVHHRKYQAQETIFNQGEVGMGFYIIKSGVVDIYVESLGQSGERKKDLVQTLKFGHFFGELALVEENEIRTATAIARTETRLVGFFRPELFEIINRSPTAGARIALRLAEIMGRRLKESLRV